MIKHSFYWVSKKKITPQQSTHNFFNIEYFIYQFKQISVKIILQEQKKYYPYATKWLKIGSLTTYLASFNNTIKTHK